ncbi:phosphotransferase [Marivita sp. S6314]|uniref:phosphotransferase n=1 Tax=Marivita sp. S6314 TaxID=2926406 RepID=UPI001FF17135|nr:phosphotransferase [Marivita sp. S6314]MCK0151389.1 phosphotransferase [Marivita sp. S6314]
MTDLLDRDAIAAWMADNVTGFRGPLNATKFATGQSNPTFKLISPSGAYVLRRKPPGQLLKSAHSVDREFRVQQALVDSDVPVTRMHALCDDDTVTGAMFYVMDHVDGRTFVDPRVPDVSAADRAAIFDDMNRVLTAIHSVDLTATGLANYGPQGSYYQRQIDRWTKQYRASETEPVADMDALIDWLGSNLPDDDGRVTLVHGDYRIDNLLFAPDAPRCVAVLDWELSTLGHPFADLAAVIMQWSLPTGDSGRGLAGVDRTALGIPEDQDFIDSYCARMGLPGIDRFGFYLAFSFFRMASILQGVKRRALDGNASNPERAAQLGAYVPTFAAGGLKAAASA